jgi:hypothetical protein
MRMSSVSLLLLGAVAVTACQEQAAPNSDRANPPAFATKAAPLTGTPTERAAVLAARVNARLAAKGVTVRLDEAWFFTTGRGVDPYRRLRTGSRWTHPTNVTYMIEPDFQANFTAEATPAVIGQGVRRSWERYNQVANITLHLNELPYNGDNNDFLDGIVTDSDGNCVDIVDLTSDALVSYDPATGNFEFNAAADNVFGGWVDAKYFAECLGSADIIGVTWTFSDVDGALGQGTDGYNDRIYTEMFYNKDFAWTTTDAVFLDFDAPTDLESVVTHEAGHAQGLGHFGGPNPNQPVRIKNNGTLQLSNPIAVMNPFYAGGELRELQPTDLAGLRTLYGSKTK